MKKFSKKQNLYKKVLQIQVSKSVKALILNTLPHRACFIM